MKENQLKLHLVKWPGGQNFLVDESYGAHKLVAPFQSKDDFYV